MPATPSQELIDYAACEPCVLPLGDRMRLALLDQISQSAGGGGVETFYRISDLLDVRISDLGDNRIYV